MQSCLFLRRSDTLPRICSYFLRLCYASSSGSRSPNWSVGEDPALKGLGLISIMWWHLRVDLTARVGLFSYLVLTCLPMSSDEPHPPYTQLDCAQIFHINPNLGDCKLIILKNKTKHWIEARMWLNLTFSMCIFLVFHRADCVYIQETNFISPPCKFFVLTEFLCAFWPFLSHI